MLGLQGEKLGHLEVRRGQRHFRNDSVPYQVEDSARAQTAEDAPLSGYATGRQRNRRLVEHVGAFPAAGVLSVEAGIATERGPKETPASARNPRAFRQTAKTI